jgi:hypothetical protein
MDPIPYTHFWSEEPEAQRRAWRPTDEVRRRLMRLWIIQALLLGPSSVVAGAAHPGEQARAPDLRQAAQRGGL